ncbi:MAG: helix-turn-helix domain-containing protein, partial [Acidobacteria bacterium]|nr:helix-turn-helix domain-containing protein [Acidobacteriota bacterium]
RIDYHGFLFRALAFQLALVFTSSRSIYFCTACGNPYLRMRDAPRRGNANFCERCGRKAAVSLADKNRQQKRKEARRLHAEGVSITCIAAQLDTKPKTVRNWVKQQTKQSTHSVRNRSLNEKE